MLNVVLQLYILYNITSYCLDFLWKFYWIQELPLADRYGANTWVLITGASAGMGKQFAIEFAKRGFSLILAGYKQCIDVAEFCEETYMVETRVIVCDFIDAWKDDFFIPFEKVMKDVELSILINNVGHRVGWNPYREMPLHIIRNSIACGTMVQATLTRIALARFASRQNKAKKSAIINITAQCNYTGICLQDNTILSMPYISVYEGSNAFGLYQSASIAKEVGDEIDILTIMPGAVITENTPFLKDAPFAIDCKSFVHNCIGMLGHVKHPTCAYWGHHISSILLNFISIDTVKYIGKKIAENTINNTG